MHALIGMTSRGRKVRRVLLCDFETYYDTKTGYSLRKMQPLEYVLDPRFQIIGMAAQLIDEEREHPMLWLTELSDIEMFVHTIAWEETAVVGHNLAFDGTILTTKLDVKPLLWVDTLGMARTEVKPFTGSASLDAASRWLLGWEPEFEAKGTMVTLANGLRKEQFSPGWLASYGNYSKHDVALTRRILDAMLPRFNESELRLLDRTIRMYLEPRLVLDEAVLSDHLRELERKKREVRATIPKDVLMSNVKFAKLLVRLGIDPPTKISPTTREVTWAFSKKDEEFTDLLEHPDPRVATVVAARLGTKSTIEETRTAKLLDMALTLPGMPVMLNYGGAHTTRLSGGGGTNFQNLPRTSPIRKAIKAERRRRIVAADASQIEARFMVEIAGQKDKSMQFRMKEDVYAITATGLYKRPITKAEAPRERNVGKVADLSLQYLSGPETFRGMCRMSQLILSPEECASIVKAWRAQNPAIVNMGRTNFELFKATAMSRVNRKVSIPQLDAVSFGYDVGRNAAFIELPNGLRIWYPKPGVYENKFGEWGFGFTKARGAAKWHQLMWPGMIANNTIQGVARVATMEHAVILTEHGANLCLQVHDELVFDVAEEHAERLAKACEIVMSRPPSWLPTVPLAAEVHIGQTYADAK